MDINLASKNYDWFTGHLSELTQEYEGQYVVIKNCKVIGEYETMEDA